MTENGRIFLGTTALSEFWDSSLPIFFLGDWCLRYDQRGQWKQGLSCDVLEYPWNDPEQMFKAKKYCDEAYEVLFRQLVEFLNKTHGVDHGLRYWQVILGEWLWRYVQIFYDRYACLKRALDLRTGLQTILLDESSYSCPTDNAEFMEFCNLDIYNLQLYSQILRAMGLEYPSRPWEDVNNKALPFKRHFKEAVNDSLAVLKSKSSRRMSNRAVAICAIAQSLLGATRLDETDVFRPTRLFFRKRMPMLKPDCDLRRHFFRMKGADEFQQICLNTLEYNFPLAFLEGYDKLSKEVCGRITQVPSVIIAAVDWRFDTRAAFYIAQAAEKGAKIIGLQHGGGYGNFDIDSMFDQELKVVDKFISWGWTQFDNPQIVPLPQPGLSREKMLRSTAKIQTFLFVASTHSRYHNIFQSSPLGPQYKAYIQNQAAFFLALPEQIKNMFLVRLYPAELGWYNRSRLEEAVPGLRYSDGKRKFLEEAKGSRLIVCDNNQTTYLQSLGLNIPSVIFWDENVWGICEAAKPFFQELKDVGVFHGTPHSAARFINDNHNRIEEWWFSAEVQNVVNKFRINYCRTSDNWKNEWYQAIRQEVINAN